MDFEEFKAEFEGMHPGEAPDQPAPVTEGLAMRFGIAGMFIFSAAISGVHTAPVIYRTIDAALVDEFIRRVTAIGSFFAVEMGILLTGYGISAEKWINRIAGGLALVVAMVCNIISVAQAFGGGDVGDIAVSLILGVFAPIMALLAGKAFEGQQQRVTAEIDRRSESYKIELATWNKQIADAYNDYQRKEDRRLQRLSPPSAPSEVSVRADTDSLQTRQAAYGYSVSPDGQQTVIKWLDDHPDDAQLGSRPLGKLIGVSHDTANKGRQQWQQQNAVIKQWFIEHSELIGKPLDILIGLIKMDTGVDVGRTSIHNVRKEIQSEQG